MLEKENEKKAGCKMIQCALCGESIIFRGWSSDGKCYCDECKSKMSSNKFTQENSSTVLNQ
jgi:hypothetical protein